MADHLTTIITSLEPTVRNQSLEEFCRSATARELLEECASLETLRRQSDNLYEQVRACLFLYAIHRFHLPAIPSLPEIGQIPFDGYLNLLERRLEEALHLFLQQQERHGPSAALSSALAACYYRLGFQSLSNQVRRSVRSVRGNQWMFRMGHPADQPLSIHPEMRGPGPAGSGFPVLKEAVPVRMDLSHSGWSDIFFLGMDYPEGARVLNVSIDLAVHGRDPSPRPPVEAYFRLIDEPVLRLTSVDLEATADITGLDEIFDFARDYLGLLKAAIIASGLVPPGLEGSEQRLSDLLHRLVGPGCGIEVISSVNNIPKGSRLAVSTSLLAALIAVCMRATRQTRHLSGLLDESERRLVAARAIMGEWLAGSGGGWQDSGGIWPGIKLIQGEKACPGDPEEGISRGRLLPSHRILDAHEIPPSAREALQRSLVLVHGGMAQNVGPILEMVTEKYLLRSGAEWRARLEAGCVLDEILASLRSGDIRAVGAATTRNFFGPLQTIIPWASNLYTETVIQQIGKAFGSDFWGFWMLGGMAGGGMGFIFEPSRKAEAQDRLQAILTQSRMQLDHSLPFAMDPLIYDFAINEQGSHAELLSAASLPLPHAYYKLMVPRWIRMDPRTMPGRLRSELDAFGAACHARPEMGGMVQSLFDSLLPHDANGAESGNALAALLQENAFDPVFHEQVRADMRSGRIGLAQNRLPLTSDIRDVAPGDVFDATRDVTEAMVEAGRQALANGEVAVITLAAGVGSRWTQGAGVVKALHPFAKLSGRYRTFVEAHLARSRHTGRQMGCYPTHIFTTSYLTHQPIQDFLNAEQNYGYPGNVILSPGRSIGLRLAPTVRDLRFAWEETSQQMLDEQAQKVRQGMHAALMAWAQQAGEGSDYTDNAPGQCIHPVGHWYEAPNLLKNGVLLSLLEQQPQLQWLMLHNIDTLGATLDPGILGFHLVNSAPFSIEVIPRRLEDRGGGLARVNGQLRLVEGLAMPREDAEFDLTYYNSLTTWLNIDHFLSLFGLSREGLHDQAAVTTAIRRMANRMPTYITLKDVKRRWGHGQEDVYPVAQFEKLWGDMTAIPEAQCQFIHVSRWRGQQLKEQAQLDGWVRDGSAAYVNSLCDWGEK